MLAFVATAPASAAGCTFNVRSHPNGGSPPFDQLYGIDALSASNIWTVGSQDAAGRGLIERFNGTKWKIVASPAKGPTSELFDVTAIAARNAWAVGYYFPSGGGFKKTLIEHWNGTKWTIVASPNPVSGHDNVLFGVGAVSASNVWAVGADGQPGTKAIILHWNGSKWTKVQGAALGPSGGGLQDVSVISAKNVVAVGHVGVVGSSNPLVERFNGTSWARDTVPGTGHGDSLEGVSTASATAQWAVGTQGGSAALQTLSVRNTGSGWQSVATPNVGGASKINLFHDVSALSAGNAWAVGEHDNASFVRRTTIAHFANGAWPIIARPNASPKNNTLKGVAAGPATNIS